MASFLARDLPLLSAQAPPRCARSAPARPENPRRRTEDSARRPPFTDAPPGETTIPRGQRVLSSSPPPPSRPGPVVHAAGAVQAGNCSPVPPAPQTTPSAPQPAHPHASTPRVPPLSPPLRPATNPEGSAKPSCSDREATTGSRPVPQEGDGPLPAFQSRQPCALCGRVPQPAFASCWAWVCGSFSDSVSGLPQTPVSHLFFIKRFQTCPAMQPQHLAGGVVSKQIKRVSAPREPPALSRSRATRSLFYSFPWSFH